MSVGEELSKIITDHQEMMGRATEMQAKLADLQALPQAVQAFAEPIAQLMESVAVLTEQVQMLAAIVAAPRKYAYGEDGMPLASVPDLEGVVQ